MLVLIDTTSGSSLLKQVVSERLPLIESIARIGKSGQISSTFSHLCHIDCANHQLRFNAGPPHNLLPSFCLVSHSKSKHCWHHRSLKRWRSGVGSWCETSGGAAGPPTTTHAIAAERGETCCVVTTVLQPSTFNAGEWCKGWKARGPFRWEALKNLWSPLAAAPVMQIAFMYLLPPPFIGIVAIVINT